MLSDRDDVFGEQSVVNSLVQDEVLSLRIDSILRHRGLHALPCLYCMRCKATSLTSHFFDSVDRFVAQRRIHLVTVSSRSISLPPSTFGKSPWACSSLRPSARRLPWCYLDLLTMEMIQVRTVTCPCLILDADGLTYNSCMVKLIWQNLSDTITRPCGISSTNIWKEKPVWMKSDWSVYLQSRGRAGRMASYTSYS